MVSQVDELNEAFVSAAVLEAPILFIRSIEDNDDVPEGQTCSLTSCSKKFMTLSEKQKQLDECSTKIADLKMKIKVMRERALEKLRICGCEDKDVPLSHEELRKRLDSKVNHLTSLMVKKRELLEETKQQRDFEKDKLDILQQEVSNANNSKNLSKPEDDINMLIGKWMSSRLGSLSLTDDSHAVLGISTSSLLKGASTQSPSASVKMKCVLKQPRDSESAFGVGNLHPLGGSMEAMEIAQAASHAMIPSVSVNRAIWEQISMTPK